MSKKPDDWMPLVIGKYLANTAHLTRDQHGAYLLLLMAYWTNGGPLPDDDSRLAAIAKATPAEWRKMQSVIMEFFHVSEGHIHQKRADEELEKARRLTEIKAEAGRKGAARKWQTHNSADGKTMAEPSVCQWQTDAPLPLPVTEERKKELPAAAGPSKLKPYTEQFEKFWLEYPTSSNMPKKPAFKAWQRMTPEKQQAAIGAIPAFRDYCRKNAWYQPIYAERFLSQEKFEGFAQVVVDPEEIEKRRDRADQLFRRGKYAEGDHGA